MGMVYRARDTNLGDLVALKLIRPDLAQEGRLAERFRSEIRLARKIRHRNVCSIFGDGEERGILYLCMELIEGQDLRRLVQERGPLPEAEAYELAIQAAEGLQAIHDAGIVHRDLKPSNIMRDARGVVRLMDFGLARHSTTGGSVVGTPEYMSPEQARSGDVGPGSDVYSLGVVIFELFTGEVPFRGDTPLATMMKHLEEAPPVTGPRAARLPSGLIPALRRALAKDPRERQASAAELAADLRRARDSASLESAPTAEWLPPAPGPGRPASRRWTLAALAAVLCVAAGVAVVVNERGSVGPAPRGAPGAGDREQTPAPMRGGTSAGTSGEAIGAEGIRHEPVSCMIANKFPLIEATWSGAMPTRARVYFRSRLSEDYYYVDMERAGGRWGGRLPKPTLNASPILHYIQFQTATGESRTEEHSATVMRSAAQCSDTARIAASGPDGTVKVFAAIPGTDLAFALKDAFGLEDLMALLKDPDPRVRERAATSLGETGAALRPAIATTVAKLRSTDPDSRVEAAGDLRKTGRRVIREITGALVETLKDSVPAVRSAAALALGEIGPGLATAVSALREAAKGPDPKVKAAAAEALGSMGSVLASALTALEDLSNNERDSTVEEAADAALSRIREGARKGLPPHGN